ncbi:MAG: FtsW/RodA/SpoVE family cell cycle protein [Candidatus Methylacidiphilales bacterium]
MNWVTLIFRKLQAFHWPLFVLMVGMAMAGIFFIESAVYLNEAPDIKIAPERQWLWFWLGLPAFFIVALTDYKWLLQLGGVAYVFSLLVLIGVLIFGVEINNAKSWIRIGGLGIQPSELCKLAFICGMSAFVIYLHPHIKKIWPLFPLALATLLPTALILKQPDLGSAAVFGPIAYLILWCGGVRKRYLALPVIAAGAVLFFCYTYVHKGGHDIPGLKTYQNNRIRTFFDPELDPRGAGWAVRQSLIAVGSGGLKGKGYKQGDQNIYGFLPRNTSHNDYIFPVIAEEFGFTGGSLVILAEGLLLWGILSIAMRSKDLGGSLLACGVCGLFFTHFFVNVGMTIQVVPVTGIPLPFMSYGGTFLVACMIGLGIIQSVWIHRKDYQLERKFGR